MSNKLMGRYVIKNSDSSDSEEDPIPSKRSALEDEDANEGLINCGQNLAKPSSRLDISDKGPVKAQKRFSIWSDVLVEQQLTDEMQLTMKVNNFVPKSDPKDVAKDRNVENYEFWRGLKNKPRIAHVPSRSSSVGCGAGSGFTTGTKGGPTKASVASTDSASGFMPKSCFTWTKNEPDVQPTGQMNARKRKRKNKQIMKRNNRPQEDITTETIAAKLREPKVDLLKKTVQTIGSTLSLKLCNEVLNIEEAGGMLTLDGKRRRSPGGVFFFLLKNEKSVTKDQVDSIFGPQREQSDQKRKLKKKARRRLDKVLQTLEGVVLEKEPTCSIESLLIEEEAGCPMPPTQPRLYTERETLALSVRLSPQPSVDLEDGELID